MDLATITQIISVLAAGGPPAVICVLVLVILALWLDRRRLIADLEKKEGRIDKIVDDFYRGNLTLSEALNSLRNTLNELRNRL
jgi:hypothetical protein